MFGNTAVVDKKERLEYTFGSPGDAAPLRGDPALLLSISRHHLHPNRRILLVQTPGLLAREDAESACSVADGKCLFLPRTTPFSHPRSPKV